MDVHMSALHWTASRGYHEMSKILLERGARSDL